MNVKIKISSIIIRYNNGQQPFLKIRKKEEGLDRSIQLPVDCVDQQLLILFQAIFKHLFELFDLRSYYHPAVRLRAIQLIIFLVIVFC